MILNTSFNRHGIATISTPRQAIEHLLEGCMDYLAIDNYLISFSDNRIVADREEMIESEEVLLIAGAVKRLSVFKEYGTEKQMSKYLSKLSKLIGINMEVTEDKRIRHLDKTYTIDEIQNIISTSL